MTQSAATRLIDGIEMPAPGLWSIDPGHADVAFVGRHFMMTKVRGRFSRVSGEVRISDLPEGSSVTATIEMASVDSGNQTRDDHLRSTDLFDVETFPLASFASTELSWDGSQGQMTGELTIKDVTKPVVLRVVYLGHVRDPWENDRAGFEATGKINREDWGVTWNMVLETGAMMVSREIELELDLELVREA